jgi:hypothetical protein
LAKANPDGERMSSTARASVDREPIELERIRNRADIHSRIRNAATTLPI